MFDFGKILTTLKATDFSYLPNMINISSSSKNVYCMQKESALQHGFMKRAENSLTTPYRQISASFCGYPNPMYLD